MIKRIYLDYNATAPLNVETQKAILEAMTLVGNPSSIHHHGRKVRQRIEETRKVIGAFFAVHPNRVIFTSGATEANNLILKSHQGPVIISAIEHDSIRRVRPEALICDVKRNGILDVNHLEALLLSQKEGRPLVSIMAANNETGIIQPLHEISTLCKKYGALWHTDAVQIVGRFPVSWEEVTPNYISLSAHKIGGPAGIGALIIDDIHKIQPLLVGGGQERSFRSGTENFLGIVGLGSALKNIQHQDWSRITKLRQEMEATLENFCPQSIICREEPGIPRLPNTTLLRMPGVQNTLQVMHFDLQGICLSAGSACSSGKVTPSHVLKAMGLPQDIIQETIRVSLGPDTTQEEIRFFVKKWSQLLEKSVSLISPQAAEPHPLSFSSDPCIPPYNERLLS